MPSDRGARRAMATRFSPASLALLMGLFALGACGGGGRPKSTTPVLGDRTSILGSSQVIEVDPAIANIPITLPPITDNADWPQPGGDPSKAIGQVALPGRLGELWTRKIAGGSTRERLAAEPMVSGGKLFVIDTSANVHAFNAQTGAPVWTTNVGGKGDNRRTEYGGGVSVTGERVFVTTGVGDVAALNASDGKEVWRVRPGGPLRGAATLSNGHLYVMSQDNQIFALSQEDGAVIWSDAGTVQSTAIFGVAAPAAAQGTVIAGFSSGELTAYRYENGRTLWGDALSRTSISTTVAALTDIDADPVIDRGRVFAIGQGGRMASYELVSGQRLWEISIAGVATPAVAGDWLFVVTDSARLLCIERATGRIRWISQLKAFHNDKKKKGANVRWHGPILGGGRLILVSTDGDIIQVDPADGQVKLQRDVKDGLSLPPVVAGGILYVLTDGGKLIAFR